MNAATSTTNVDFANVLAGTVNGAPSYNGGTLRSVINVGDLENQFEETDQHKVGRIDIAGYGSFTTVATVESFLGAETVEIISAPAGIVNANGAAYTLGDDDAGSVPPFVMVGFDAPPVSLPKVPDTGLMGQVFQNAYVNVAPPDLQYYDANTQFDRNIATEGEGETTGDFNRDLTSTADFWVVHVTSAFQGYIAKDADPDGEQGVEGLQYGLTIEQGLWPLPIHSSGSLVFLETIRDDKRGNITAMTTLQRYTVTHEAGHQFLLQHGDDYAPPDGSAGDYIMTDKTDESGMAPNVAFSAKSINKIRNTPYPPQP